MPCPCAHSYPPLLESPRIWAVLLNRPGMASRVLSYATRAPGHPRPPPPAVGERRWIDSEAELPFAFGPPLPPASQLSALHTNLTCSPLASHAAPTRRFLLVLTRRMVDGQLRTFATLRALPRTVEIVGQQQPVTQTHEVERVPRPRTRDFNELLYRRISVSVHQRVFGQSTRMLATYGGAISLDRVMAGWPRWLKPKVVEVRWRGGKKQPS